MTSKKDDGPQRFVLAEVLAERAEKHPPIEIDLGDGGEPLRVPRIEMWGDDAIDVADTDPIESARRLLGDEYDRFVNAGGSAAVLRDIVLNRAREGSLGK